MSANMAKRVSRKPFQIILSWNTSDADVIRPWPHGRRSIVMTGLQVRTYSWAGEELMMRDEVISTERLAKALGCSPDDLGSRRTSPPSAVTVECHMSQIKRLGEAILDPSPEYLLGWVVAPEGNGW